MAGEIKKADRIKKANVGYTPRHIRAKSGHDASISQMAKAAQPASIALTSEQLHARRSRSIAIAVSLGVLVILFYIVTLVKGPGVLVRPL